MRIACDIDGCLNLFTQRLIEVVEKKFQFLVDHNFSDSEILESLNIRTLEDKHKFWLKFQDEVDKCKNFPDATKYLELLRAGGVHITLITARGFHISTRTENWLKDRGFQYDNIIFNAGTKADACEWQNINVMIEDTPANIIALAERGITVIVPTHPYNSHIKHKNVFHCRNWEEIYKQIRTFYLK